jgi:hypothetical protein
MNLINNKIYRTVLIILWLLIFANAFATYKNLKDLDIPATVLEFDITLNSVSGESERGVFYYDTGKGFNKDEVKVFEYKQNIGQVMHYRVPLATNKDILKLRFDPLDHKGSVTIQDLKVQRYIQNDVPFVKAEIEANPQNSIGKVAVTPRSVLVEATGEDSHFILVDNFSKFQKQ